MDLYKMPFLFFWLLFSLSYQGNLSAAGLNWLHDAAIRFFTTEDIELMMSTMRTSLNDNDDGVTLDWENPETGSSGSVTPVATAIKNDMTCRKTQFINNAEGREGNSTFVFCKYPDDKWKIYTK